MIVNVTLTPGQAAAQVDVGAHNIRRWCEWHKAYLSESASPAPGAPRRLTLLDVEVLKTVKTLRDQGLQTPDINERLSVMTFAVVDTAITESPQAVQQGQPQAEGAMMVVEVLRSVEARLAALEQGQRATEAQRPTWRDVIILVLAGVIVGLMIGLSIWWFQ